MFYIVCYIVCVCNMQVLNSNRQAPHMVDFCDGSQYLTHSLFSVDNTALQIILYYDELELCNPLGSRRKKHKLGLSSFV